jgi:hypothetical protein
VLLRRSPAQALLLARMALVLVALWLLPEPVLRPVSRPVMALRRWVLPAGLRPLAPPRQPLRPHSALLRLLALRLGLRMPLPVRRLRWLQRWAPERLADPTGF